MGLAVRPGHRSQGLGGSLLRAVLDTVSGVHVKGEVERVYLHVQADNEDAIRFYQRWGFRLVEEIAGYYPQERRVAGAGDAWVLEKWLG